MKTAAVLFVCIGNICRSPTAEGIFHALVNKAGLEKQIKIDSAGMSGSYVGERAHGLSREAAAKRGYDLQSRARKFCEDDFKKFDYILPMDSSNIPMLERYLENKDDWKKVIPFIDLCKSYKNKFSDVPDPYYGGKPDFDLVLDICLEGCTALLEKIQQEWASS